VEELQGQGQSSAVNLVFQGLLAAYHAAVWEAAEQSSDDFDMAGVEEAKALCAMFDMSLRARRPPLYSLFSVTEQMKAQVRRIREQRKQLKQRARSQAALKVKPPAPSVWGCVEFDAISRAFDYAGYVDFHTKTKCVGAKVSAATYAHLWNSFNQSMQDDVSMHPVVDPKAPK